MRSHPHFLVTDWDVFRRPESETELSDDRNMRVLPYRDCGYSLRDCVLSINGTPCSPMFALDII